MQTEYDRKLVKLTRCLMCAQPIGDLPYREIITLARFGQMLFEHEVCPEITTIYTADLTKTEFSCGCIWRWWIGEPSPLNSRWEKQCHIHSKQPRPADCRCLVIGQDDGATTCWQHHDCMKGDCTHDE